VYVLTVVSYRGGAAKWITQWNCGVISDRDVKNPPTGAGDAFGLLAVWLDGACLLMVSS